MYQLGMNLMPTVNRRYSPGPEPKSMKVRFAALMDLCRLKHPELEHLQTYRDRVVLRIDIVKDDTGEYAVFTEQGAPAFPLTAAKVLDTIYPLPCMAGEAIDAVSACTMVERESFSQTVGRNARLLGSDSLEIVRPKRLG